jgi:hypothetical protein
LTHILKKVERLVKLGATRYPWRYKPTDDFMYRKILTAIFSAWSKRDDHRRRFAGQRLAP